MDTQHKEYPITIDDFPGSIRKHNSIRISVQRYTQISIVFLY